MLTRISPFWMESLLEDSISSRSAREGTRTCQSDCTRSTSSGVGSNRSTQTGLPCVLGQIFSMGWQAGLARERYYDLASLRQRRHHGGTICGAQGNQMSKLSYWAAVTLALEPQGSKLRTALRR